MNCFSEVILQESFNESAGMKRYLHFSADALRGHHRYGGALSSRSNAIYQLALFGENMAKKRYRTCTGMRNSLQKCLWYFGVPNSLCRFRKSGVDLLVDRLIRYEKRCRIEKIDLMRKVKVDFVEGAISHSGATKEQASIFGRSSKNLRTTVSTRVTRHVMD